LQRKFNCPTGLQEQRVELVIESATVALRVTLNGIDLTQLTSEPWPHCWDITSQLAPHNELILEFELPAATDVLPELGLVKLVISP
jgi:hypothetical protein